MGVGLNACWKKRTDPIVIGTGHTSRSPLHNVRQFLKVLLWLHQNKPRKACENKDRRREWEATGWALPQSFVLTKAEGWDKRQAVSERSADEARPPYHRDLQSNH